MVTRFSDILMDHFNAPRNSGAMDKPDCIGLVGVPGQGPFLLLCLRVEDGYVVEARYQTHGCGASIAAGSMLTVLIMQRSVGDCLAITADQLTEALGGVPPDKLHCPAMAIAALRNALRDFAVAAPGPT
jgi:nitrogen fixation NifU-like protein